MRCTVVRARGAGDAVWMLGGRYEVKVSKAGFATTIQQNLTLTVGLTTTLKLQLKVQGTSESVIVQSVPQVDIVTDSSTATLNGTRHQLVRRG